ncbi:MAG TPA: hypothetical protein VFW83_04260, partial [Bryobacteraceae bacterium]|nr:hypothetical protein [Bryobacteraceae bacterium]
MTVQAGVPLRLYLTERLPMSVGDTAVAKLIEPIYSFDRVVIPAGAEVLGRVTQLDPAPKLVRIQSILNGDFTPLHRARVEFTTILLPNGRSILIHTISSEGLPTLYSPPKPDTKKKTAKPDPAPQPADDSHAADAHQDPIHGLLNLARQQGKQQIKAEIKSQIDSHTYGLGSVVRGPNKKERLEDLLISRLPYHPQWYRKSTRFDAVLSQPISFGTVALPAASLQQIGSRAELDRAVEVRFLSTISSGTARRGDP